MTDTTRFFDRHTKGYGSYIDGQLLDHTVSEWQDIKIVDTTGGRRIMLIDDIMMLSNDTHNVYHEHMAHIPMSCVDKPRSALVIGGGDGGMVTELVKYQELEKVVLAELDGDVMDVSRKFFPELTSGLDDPRVEIRIGDGAAYLAEQSGAFDVIIIDSTDVCEEAMHGDQTANPLIEDEFYDNLEKALRPGGVVMQMLGSPTFYQNGMRKIFARLRDRFSHFKPMLMPCPFYISGDWCGGLYTMNGDLTPRHDRIPLNQLKHFNLDLARAALVLPNDVQRMLNETN